jgi:hypothetical protein
MSISGLSHRIDIDPRINKTEPANVKPQHEEAPLAKEPVSLLPQQIENVKSGVQVNGNKASHEEIQSSGNKLADDCVSNENLKTNFKAENFQKNTGIESPEHTAPSAPNLSKNTSPSEPVHENTTPSEPHKAKGETHEDVNKELKLIGAQANFIYAGTVTHSVVEITEHVVETIAKAKELKSLADGGEELVKGAEKGLNSEALLNGLGAVSSFVVGGVSLISAARNIGDIKEIKEKKQVVEEKIEAKKQEIKDLPLDSPDRAKKEQELSSLVEERNNLKHELKDKKLEVGKDVSEAVKAGFEFATAIGGSVGKNVVPGVGLVVAGFEIAKSVSNIRDLSEKKQEVKAEIRAQKEIINNPDSKPEDVKAAQDKLEELNKEKKGLNKEIRREVISGGLALAGGVVSFIPGVGTLASASISLVKTGLEISWEHKKE